MLCCLAVSVFLGFVHSQRQAGDCFRDNPDAGVDRRKLDRGIRVDRLPGTAGAEVEGWRGADAVLGLIPRSEQGSEGIFHELQWRDWPYNGIMAKAPYAVGLGFAGLIYCFKGNNKMNFEFILWRVSHATYR